MLNMAIGSVVSSPALLMLTRNFPDPYLFFLTRSLSDIHQAVLSVLISTGLYHWAVCRGVILLVIGCLLIDDGAMLTRFAAAFGLLSDRRIRRVLLLSVIGAFVVLVLLAAVLSGGLFLLPSTGWYWLDGLLASLGMLVIFVLALALFPALTGVAVSLFLDVVAASAEAHYTDGLPPPRSLSPGRAVMLTLRYAGLIVVVNILLLPALLLGPLYPLLYYGANGYLLGREYFDLVALRRLCPDQIAFWRRRAAGRIWRHGMVVAFLFSLPVVNLIAPVIATAALALLLVDLMQNTPPVTGRRPQSPRRLVSGSQSKRPEHLT